MYTILKNKKRERIERKIEYSKEEEATKKIPDMGNDVPHWNGNANDLFQRSIGWMHGRTDW